MEIIHDPGRGVLLVKVVFRDSDKLKLRNVLLMTVLEARNLHGPTRVLWNRGSVTHR